MRLSGLERRTLVDVISSADPQAEIWLHGSRVRDDARGGDIDVLVLSRQLGFADKLDLLVRLHAALGEQKIDLTIARDTRRPFVRLAQAGGVRL